MIERITDFMRRLFTTEEEPLFSSQSQENKIPKRINWRDRRIFERMPVDFSLRFRDMQENQWGLVQGQDLSAKGIGFLAEKDLPVKTPLEIWLPLVNKGESFYTRGSVAWSQRVEPDKYRIGVELARPELMGVSQVLRAM